jgi:hypothetical protein
MIYFLQTMFAQGSPFRGTNSDPQVALPSRTDQPGFLTAIPEMALWSHRHILKLSHLLDHWVALCSVFWVFEWDVERIIEFQFHCWSIFILVQVMLIPFFIFSIVCFF